MNIFVDENIPQQIVTLLRAEGYTVEYVMRQVEDRIILDDAYQQHALLITSDKDFERLVLDEHRPTAAKWLLNVHSSLFSSSSSSFNSFVSSLLFTST